MLGGYGDQPTDSSTSLLHGDALQQAASAQLASLLTAKQDGGDPLFVDKSGDMFDGSFTLLCLKTFMRVSDLHAARKNGNTTLGFRN